MLFVGGRLLYRCSQLRFAAQYSGSENVRPSLLQRLRSSWIPIPTGVGITLLAILQWRRLERERNKELKVAKDWEITCYKAMPLRSMSRVFGWVSEKPVPETMRPYLYKSYARVFGVNLEEMAEAMDFYECFAAFFTRRLKDGCRPIDSAHPLVSPADGTVLNSGRLTSCQVEQVKGVTYSLKAFLGDVTWSKPAIEARDINFNSLINKKAMCDMSETRGFGGGGDTWEEYKRKLLHNPDNELYQCVVYLAPGDYHRFHSPVDWHVTFRRHFQGELLSVNPIIARWIPGLFTLNERAVYVGSWQHGYFSMTAVGATNVGSIRVYDDKTLHTNTRKWRDKTRHRDKELNCLWSKGEEIGEFRLGSTIVLLFEAPRGFRINLRAGTKLKVGAAIA